jgi:hypothetical protein
MTIEQVRAALENTLYWGQPYQVHLTGGEPFLKFTLLLNSVEVANELSIPVYAETNAGWCVDETEVTRRFQTLKDTGLSSLLISCSPFHAETVPPERTMMAIRKSLEVFGSRGTIVYLPDWLDMIRHFGLTKPTPLETYIQEFGFEEAGRLFWGGYGLISGGRSGYRLGHLTPKRSPESFNSQDCHRELFYAPHSHFDLYGNYIPAFCGGLTIGNWNDLPDLMHTFQSQDFPPLIETLINTGPYGLYEIAFNDYDYVALKDGYVGKCHLCVDVRNHLRQLDDFPELQPSQFYENF